MAGAKSDIGSQIFVSIAASIVVSLCGWLVVGTTQLADYVFKEKVHDQLLSLVRTDAGVRDAVRAALETVELEKRVTKLEGNVHVHAIEPSPGGSDTFTVTCKGTYQNDASKNREAWVVATGFDKEGATQVVQVDPSEHMALDKGMTQRFSFTVPRGGNITKLTVKTWILSTNVGNGKEGLDHSDSTYVRVKSGGWRVETKGPELLSAYEFKATCTTEITGTP